MIIITNMIIHVVNTLLIVLRPHHDMIMMIIINTMINLLIVLRPPSLC